MGKTKPKKRGKHRMDPMGAAGNGNLEENTNSVDNLGGRTIPLLQKVWSFY